MTRFMKNWTIGTFLEKYVFTRIPKMYQLQYTKDCKKTPAMRRELRKGEAGANCEEGTSTSLSSRGSHEGKLWPDIFHGEGWVWGLGGVSGQILRLGCILLPKMKGINYVLPSAHKPGMHWRRQTTFETKV